VARLPGVERSVTVASGIAWLTRSWSADGYLVDRPPSGLAIPLEVAGADPDTYGPFLAPADRGVLADLARGEGVLGASSARLRHLGPGAELAFGPNRVRVAAVLPDAEIGAHELFVSKATAATLGVSEDRYLLVDPDPGASRPHLSAAMRGLLPPGRQLQIRGPGETPYFRYGDAVLPQIRMKELFGEFAARPIAGGYLAVDPAWASASIVTARVPLLGEVHCGRAVIPLLRGALSDLAQEGLGQLIDPGDYGGCYSARFLNRDPGAGISHHAWGAAIDINVSSNRYGQTPHQDPRVVAAFEQWGFTWGGRWIRPDGMHFEFLRFPQG